MDTNRKKYLNGIRVHSRPFVESVLDSVWACIAISLVISGCTARPGENPATMPASQPHNAVKMVSQIRGDAPGDAQRTVETVIQLDLYRLAVPFGTISGNEDFWKTIDEQCVDVATYDLLFKNGVRIGRAATAQWDQIARLIERHPATFHKTALVATEMKSLALPMKQGDEVEHIFYYGPDNALIGRSFERWENYMELSFQSAPRKPMHVRVALSPAVRSTRKRLEFNFRNDEQPVIEYVAPRRMYDLNLRADLPPETFLVVAPSSEGKWPTSIGAAFLTIDAPAERMEQVLLIVPKPFMVAPPAQE